MTLASDQKKYLKEHLQRINDRQGTYSNYAKSVVDSLPLKPAAVIEAEARIKRDSAIVRRFENVQRRRKDAIKKKKRATADLCERTILAGDFKKALALLDKFETMKF